MSNKRLMVSVPEELADRARKMARKLKVTDLFIARQALSNYLDQCEEAVQTLEKLADQGDLKIRIIDDEPNL